MLPLPQFLPLSPPPPPHHHHHHHHCPHYLPPFKGYFKEFPPMAIGRFVWDTWIMSRALHSDYPTINGANKIQAYHINHHYSIKGLPQTGLNNAPLDKKKESPEFRENMRLGEANGGILGLFFSLSLVMIGTCQ
eukprot:TRINITY_DN1708_c0_g2_i5.p1 TRINITY_DN1708_c0_g2~~TRINITY_DN1708_c0_g2_i5.p1  ORF type:complete len:134 (-),score=15.08 TRINITY_DN1708_c0_g2_i5:101-502(-)